jgi:hypothetical protein
MLLLHIQADSTIHVTQNKLDENDKELEEYCLFLETNTLNEL